jgi:hypothetical protein
VAVDEHQYRWSARSIAVLVAAAVAMALAIAVLLGGLTASALFVAVVVPIVVTLQMRVYLSPAGARFGRRRAAWSELELAPGRWGMELRTPVETTERSRRFGVVLDWYDADWRDGPIGQDLRRWAPELLDREG